MTSPNHDRRMIKEALVALATAHGRAVTEIQLAIDGLTRALELHEILYAGPRPSKLRDKLVLPHADRSTLSIAWRDHTCFVGNTLLFRFFERLAQTPNHYVSHVDLLEDVWGTERESSTIRGVVKRLRDRLITAGMPDLAGAIDGSVNGHYGLKLV